MVNDLFIGPKSHTSARYILQWGDSQESAILIRHYCINGTYWLYTGWFQSILAGTMAITGKASHPLLQGVWLGDKNYNLV